MEDLGIEYQIHTNIDRDLYVSAYVFFSFDKIPILVFQL